MAFRLGSGGTDMKVVVLNFYRMHRVAKGAFFAFTVFKTHFTDMPATAGYFNTDDFAVIQDVHPVVIMFTFVLVVHDSITPNIFFLSNPNIALDQHGGNPRINAF